MIAYVKGELAAIEETSVIIDNQGMGFRVYTPIREELLRIGVGSQIKLHTYMNVREDAMILFGFLQPEALSLFKQLINVNGVGPKYALAILTAMSVDQVILAIASEDKKALTKVSGIGPKTAGRIILDLKDKVSFTPGGDGADIPVPGGIAEESTVGAAAEAVMALLALGYGQSEASAAVKKVAQPDMSVEEIIKLSLKQLF
ncbi:MAG: Holliday junction branch migration protein RuvA [Firmicutes bacterium]|nr:Holliday junction branch migration protein RuvA [Bacillota bacterium]